MLRASATAAAALLFASGAAASEEVLACAAGGKGECPSSSGEEGEGSALLQVQGAKPVVYQNPCAQGSEPKDSVGSYCEKAGFVFVGEKDADEFVKGTENCCVPTSWTCNMGTEKDCKHDGVAKPAFLGVVTQTNGAQGNCCLPPIPSSATSPTWSMDTQVYPSKKECKSSQTVAKNTKLIGYWTGSKCMATCEDTTGQNTYWAPTCTQGQAETSKNSGEAEEDGLKCSCEQ